MILSLLTLDIRGFVPLFLEESFLWFMHSVDVHNVTLLQYFVVDVLKTFLFLFNKIKKLQLEKTQAPQK